MRKNLWLWITILLAAAALVASAILLVDYVRPAPVFCDAEGACGKVKQTVFARPFGIPMPGIGLAGVFAIALASLIPGREARFGQMVIAIIGGLVALFLFGIQGSMKVLCPFCAVVDASTIGLAVISVIRWRKELDPPAGRLVPASIVTLLLAVMGITLAIGFNRRAILPGDLPQPIADEMRASGSRKVTVVDFVDFECPFCRMTHAELAPVLLKHHDRVRVARKHVPLRMHPHAMDAAKAGCCGENLGKGEEMADALFKAPPEDLTPEGCEKLAQQAGIDLDRFRACVKDPSTEARIENDKAAFKAVKGHGLPTIWVDTVKLEGATDRETLENTVSAAVRAL